ncbi:MAG: hypothetical protein AAFO86_13940 [Pseudomonadota bacterium]
MNTALKLGGVPALSAQVTLYLAAIVAIGWIASLIGTAMLADESMVAAAVFFAVSTVWILIWVLVPDGTF